MSYKCRIFTKDLQTVQDVKDYSIKNKSFKFIADGQGKEYKLDDTEYLIVPTDVFKGMIDKLYVNGKNAKDEAKPKKGQRAKLNPVDEVTEI